ncbi:hypothetical protein AVEN_22179-1 [Araneus ventricosus]|uniref:Uncharacterized protein n=1 Tax=Araneus ventricosus TaxID=182803 RepID=A0A4Y2K6N4_ARAVE|nr:hypothetical protein AVEN_22179-1 [Araneus ventricosus]
MAFRVPNGSLPTPKENKPICQPRNFDFCRATNRNWTTVRQDKPSSSGPEMLSIQDPIPATWWTLNSSSSSFFSQVWGGSLDNGQAVQVSSSSPDHHEIHPKIVLASLHNRTLI